MTDWGVFSLYNCGWVSCPLFYILVLSLPSSIHLVRHLMATSSSCYCIPIALPLVQLLVLSLQSLCHLLGLYYASLFSICILIFSIFICFIVYVLSLEFLGHVHMLCVVIIWCFCKVSFFSYWSSILIIVSFLLVYILEHCIYRVILNCMQEIQGFCLLQAKPKSCSKHIFTAAIVSENRKH
jgi:hypothetical protein